MVGLDFLAISNWCEGEKFIKQKYFLSVNDSIIWIWKVTNTFMPFSKELFQFYQVYIKNWNGSYDTKSKSWKTIHWTSMWVFIKDKNVFFYTICFVFLGALL